MSENNQASSSQIQIKAEDKQLKGLYSNMVQVGHTQEEFILDFMNIFPPQGQLLSRVILSPQHMKRLTEALEANLKQYESQFGAIPAGSAPAHKIGFQTE